MFCRKCGKTIPDDSKFCPYCGERAVIEGPQSDDAIETVLYGRCIQCGQPLKADEEFICKSCQRESPTVGEPVQAYGTDYDKLSRPKRHGGIVFAVIAVLFVMCIGIYASRSVQPTDADTDAVSSEASTAVASASTPSTAPADTAQAKKPDLELLSNDGTFDSAIGAIHITGSVKNNSGKTFSYVQIQFILYDKGGAQVGTALANTNGLEPGNTWKYDAIGMADSVSSFKAVDLSGY